MLHSHLFGRKIYVRQLMNSGTIDWTLERKLALEMDEADAAAILLRISEGSAWLIWKVRSEDAA